MFKIFKWLSLAALGLVLLFSALVFALHRWVSTDDFKQRVASQATAALGVPVTLGSVSVDMWPLPAVAFNQVKVQTQPAITVGRLEARPRWQPLLRGQLVVATLIVRQGVLPQAGLDAVLAARQKQRVSSTMLLNKELLAHISIGLEAKKMSDLALKTAFSPQNPAPSAMEWLPRRTVLSDVAWVNTAGEATALDGQADLADDGLPDKVSLTLIRGHLQGLRASMQRQTAATAAAHQWALQVDVGGGKITGPITLQPASASKPPELQASLQTQGVEVAALTAPSKTLSGLLDASTSLNAKAATTGGLADALQTATTFTVRNAVLNGIDLAKAVKTVGISRGGQTRLDTLSGQIKTQGRAGQLKELVASSGMLSASGQVDVSSEKVLVGRVDVALANDSKLGKALGGMVGVPLVVGGTVAAPQLTLERSALIGGVLGTLVLPGAGTGAGLKLGGRVGEGLKSLMGK
jgi:hypothetical protein